MTDQSAADSALFTQALDDAWASVQQNIPRLGTARPRIGNPDLTYAHCGAADWVDSFWNGQLWLAYSATGESAYFDAARAYRPYFIDRLARPASHNHDLGFLYSLSVVADYRLTGDSAARDLGLAAAEALTRRYNAVGRFIQAWNPPLGSDAATVREFQGKIIVDCMMNLALLCWATQESGDPRYQEIAIAHADTNTTYAVRADGSTYHTYNFDIDTGQPLGGFTHQGFADESCWSRGQSWSIHGYSQLYHYTGEARFLTTARQLADYAIAHLPADTIPYWDYLLTPDAPHYRDSSAASIMAAGLFLLADALPGDPAATNYRAVAQRLLRALIADYRTIAFPQAEGLLLHGASHVPRGLGDAMLPYGDYFYVEALLRALGRISFFW